MRECLKEKWEVAMIRSQVTALMIQHIDLDLDHDVPERTLNRGMRCFDYLPSFFLVPLEKMSGKYIPLLNRPKEVLYEEKIKGARREKK